MAGRIRAQDWARTPLGPIEAWPQGLRTAVRLMLATRHPAFLFWGPDLRCLYNDAYAAYLGPEKHPAILGAPGREAWAEAWHAIGPEIEGILAGGEAAWHEDRLVPIIRQGRRDDAWWTYSLSPVDDEASPSGVGGVLAFCADTTRRTLARNGAEKRYRTLFDSIEEGFCVIEVLFDAEGRPHDYRFLEVNPAFERHTGLRGAAGRTVREFAPGHEKHWFEIYGRVALTGKPVRFVDRAAEVGGRWFDVYAFRVGGAEKRQVAVLFSDVTARRRAEAALRASEERQAFLLALADRLRPLADPAAAMAAASEALGRHLEAGRCGYGEVDATGELFVVGRDWTDGIMPSVRGAHRIDDFGPEIVADYRAGRAVAIDDVLADPRARGVEAAYEAIGGLRASLAVPLLKGGRWIATLFVQGSAPRRWTPGEEALVREVAERAWAAVERARAEAALRASEERYRALFTAIDEGVMVIERLPPRPDGLRDWRYVAMNPAAQAMFGTGDLTGRTVRDNFPDEDEGWYDLYDRALETGEVARFEREAKSQGMFLQMYVARVDAPERRRVMAVMQDVTARKRAEAALRESDERFRSLAEATPDVIYIVDAADRRVAYLSPAYERVWGEPRDAMLRDVGRWAELLHPEDRDAALERQRVLYEQPGTPTGDSEYRIVRADGSVRHIRDNAVPIRDAAGRVVRVAGIARDVTDRRLAEAKVAASERRLRVLMERIPQLVWRADADGAWTWAGPQWTGFTGQPGEEALGDGWLRMVHPDDRAAARRTWDVARASGHMAGDWRLRRASDESWRWFQTRAVAVRGADGDGVEWLGTSTDVNDQMEARQVLARSGEELEAIVAERTADLVAAEEQLRQSQKMEAVGQLTGGIAHDFNNMLQGVAGGLEMARRRAAEGRTQDVERYLKAARDSVDRAAGLTRRLLAFARRQRLEPRPVSVDALVEGMAELVGRTVGVGTAVDLDLRDGQGAVLCDANELENALLNLCINARDAMPGGGRLRIATADVDLSPADAAGPDGAAPGPYVELSVADTGHGMAPEVLRRVFEPFFTTKPQGQGTGLGLSQTYGFARQSGGLVRIESEPGRGTTVRLLLPRQGPRAAAAAGGGRPAEDPAAAPEQAAGLGGTVLLVDDEAGARGPAAERLRETGLRVLEARDGPDALRLLAEGAAPRLDLLVSDVGLPNGMNGRQLAEAVRERWPALPVLFITGYAGAIRLPPGSEVIGKPFTLDALARRVAALLAATGRAAAETEAADPPAAGP